MVETLPYTYTSQAEIESVYGIRAVKLRLDDSPITYDTDDAEDQYLSYIIDEATDIVNQYILQRYNNEEANSNSSWVRRRATYIACYLLSQRRGQAKQYITRYREIIEDLERVLTGEIPIPRLGTSADFSPAMSNLIVDDRYYKSKIRHERNTSVGGEEGVQNIDYMPGIDWW